jgi:2-hydroxychromene-2-carboxylate isomerase
LRAVWSEGADLTNDRTLCALPEEAGLSQGAVQAALGDASWRMTAEHNRQALLFAGLWGAPTYRVNGAAAIWGRDRLWAVEAQLRRAAVL